MGKGCCPLQTQDRFFFDCDDCRFYIIFDEDENEKDYVFTQLIIHFRKITRELKYL